MLGLHPVSTQPISALEVATGTTSASIAATDAADVAVISTTVTTGAAIAGTDAPDVAAITADNWTTSQIAATDSPDVAAITTSVTTGAAVSATDSADVAAITTTVTTGAALASTDGADTASITADSGTPVAVVAPVGGGRSRVRRRDKIIVVAWGEEYEVATQAEAQALFTKLKSEAAAKAPIVVAKAVKKAEKAGTPPVVATPKIVMRGPLEDFTDAFAQTLTEIAEIYQQAAAVAEIARQAAEDDEEDAIMALLV